MARQIVNLGSSPNKGDGDPLRVAFGKINENFEELYDATPAGGRFVGDVEGSLYVDSNTILVDNVSRQFNGTVNGDLIGSVFADDSAIMVDAISQSFFGNLTGDVTGSVFGDDSTILVDAVNGVIPGYISVQELKDVVAQSTDFTDFKLRISNL